MNKEKYVFSQLLDFLDRNDFNYLARKYEGDKYVKQFTCDNQLATLMFGQLSGRESLRDVVLATQAHSTKATHLEFGKFVTRSNLSKANNNRDCRIFEEFAYKVGTVRKCYLFPNKLIANALNILYFDMEKKNSSNRPWKAEIGGIAK